MEAGWSSWRSVEASPLRQFRKTESDRSPISAREPVCQSSKLSAMTFVKISLSEGRNFLNKFRVPGTGTHRL